MSDRQQRISSGDPDGSWDLGYEAAAIEAVSALWLFPEQRRGVVVALAYGAFFHDGLAPANVDSELIDLLFAAYDAGPAHV